MSRRAPWTVRWVAGAVLASSAAWIAVRGEAAEPSASAPAVFARANDRYRHEQFDEAIAGYQTMLQQGVESGALYYNLGNALLKRGHKSQALWAYLKAKTFLPRDADVQANLEYVQSLLAPGVAGSVAPSRAVRWLTLRQRFTTAELALGAILLLWLAVACRVIAAWSPRLRGGVRPFAWGCGIAAGVSWLALMVQTAGIDAVPKAVVILGQADAKFSPQSTGTTHFTLPEGTVVCVLGRDAGWIQVRRGDGRSGWVPEETTLSL